MRLFLLCLGLLVAVITSDVPSREQEPDNSESRPFTMVRVMRQLCQGMKTLLEGKAGQGIEIHNSMELSHVFVEDFDTDSNMCISGKEIRDVAANFRGNLAGFRTLFEHILDEDRSGCVEAEEMSRLVLDCMKSAAGWRDTERKEMDDIREMQVVMPQTLEEDELTSETTYQEEETTAEEEEELTEENSEDRRSELEEKKSADTEEYGLTEAVKEMVCSLFRKENEDVRLGAAKVMDALSTTEKTGFSYEEMFEFIGHVGLGRDEVDDLSAIIDENQDQFVSLEEMMNALDGCPTPAYIDIPIINTRPMIHIDEVPCPSQANVFKAFRALAMKFLGSRQISFEGAPEAVREFYESIAQDIENVITPEDMDIPMTCVEECWEGIDSNQDGALDLMEFERLALDVFEEFLPRPVEGGATLNIHKSGEVNLANIPRQNLDMLAETAGRLFGELGLNVPEGDMDAVISQLVKDAGVKAFFDKVTSGPQVDEKEDEILAEIIAPILRRLS